MRNVLRLLLLCPITAFGQGPWSPGSGHGYAQAMYTFIPTYSELYVGGNETTTTEREISDRTLSLYGEVGISPQWSVGADVPLVFVATDEPTDEAVVPMDPEGTLTSPGNLSLSAKYTFLQRKLVAALIKSSRWRRVHLWLLQLLLG
ncbi:MAG: hypothetical protein AAGA85_24355 [Bacteroidota bacterium]